MIILKVLLFLEHSFSLINNELYCEKVITNDYISRYTSIFDSVTICARENKLLQNYIKEPLHNVGFLPLPNYNSNQILLHMQSLVKIIRQEINYYDAIIIRAPSSISLLAYSVATKSNLPYIAEIVINPMNFFSNNKNYLKKAINFVGKSIMVNHTKKLCLNANGVSYVTERSLQKLFPSHAKKYGESKQYFETFYSSIDLKDDKYSDIINNYDKNSNFVLCHIGWMVGYNKGHMRILKAVKKLKEKDINIFVNFIGDGPKLEEFKQYSVQLGISENINFLGKIDNFSDIQKVLSNSHLFVFPSQAEGLPRSVLEAMANSLPCIASDIDGMSELLSDEVLFDLEDFDRMVFLIEKMIKDDEFRILNAKLNYKKARSYHYDILSKKRMDFYMRLYHLAESKNGIMNQ